MRDHKRTKELALKSYKFELSTRYNNINANPTKKFAYLAHISMHKRQETRLQTLGSIKGNFIYDPLAPVFFGVNFNTKICFELYYGQSRDKRHRLTTEKVKSRSPRMCSPAHVDVLNNYF